MFGATGDQKSDVEKPSKKNWKIFQLTNYFLFLKLSRSDYGARRTVVYNALDVLGGSPSSFYEILRKFSRTSIGDSCSENRQFTVGSHRMLYDLAVPIFVSN